MRALRDPRHRLELILVPLVAALCVGFIIAAVVMDKDGTICPPASWRNDVQVSVPGAAGERVAAITACAGDDCVPLTPLYVKTPGVVANLLEHRSDGSWVLDVGPQPPTALTFRAFDAAGALLLQQTTALNWTRVGGSEQCGGPMAEMRVTLTLT